MRVFTKPSARRSTKCDRLGASSAQAEHLRIIQEACAWMQRSEHPPLLRELAAMAGFSPFYFHRLFRRWVGITPREYAAAWQRERLVLALSQGMPVLQAIYAAGYSSTSRVYGRLEQLLGMTPAQVRMGAPGIRIRYVLSPCPGGWLMVAAARRGLCALDLGSNSSDLLRGLSARFPKARLVDGGSAMAVVVASLACSLPPVFICTELPREIRAMALQRRLWSMLQRTQLASINTYSNVERILPLLKSLQVGAYWQSASRAPHTAGA